MERDAQLRKRLADYLVSQGAIRSDAIERAFRSVPRHRFVPHATAESAYADAVIRIKEAGGVLVSSLSQPAMIAQMLEQLELKTGQRVLEIGTGSGYTAALLADIVGPGGIVSTVDMEADLVDAANQTFESLGIGNVQAFAADGALGLAQHAPYDRILLTVASTDIESAWWQQLAPGGIIVLPLSLKGGQKSIAFERTDGTLQSRSSVDCGFVTMRGSGQHEIASRIHEAPDLFLFSEQQLQLDARQLSENLLRPAQTRDLGVRFDISDFEHGLLLWIGLHDDRFVRLDASGEGSDGFPSIGLRADTPASAGIAQDGCIALFDARRAPFGNGALSIWQYGPQESLAERLAQLSDEWVFAGRPGSRGISISAVPRFRSAEFIPSEVEGRGVTLQREHTVFYIQLR